MAKLCMPLRLYRACGEAKKAFKQVRPHVVLGMGGYVTVPGGLVARKLGVTAAGLTSKPNFAERFLIL